uniref:ATP-dependent DNA helicase n=2 Tax=Brassica TaxID=3705 RepID=A0A0D3A0Q2_BRAOL
LLKENDQSLADYPDISLPDDSILTQISNTVLMQELSYDTQQENETHTELFASMNQDQKMVYHAVLQSVDKQSGQLFFVNAAGGTGKTYLYRTIIAKLRSTNKVVIPVASSGVAAL